jgi:shikimate dehydrogenase
MKIDSKTKILAVIGHPITHSKSPEIQNKFIEESGKNFVYLAFDVTEKSLQDFIASVRALDIKGFNITMPLKEKIIPYLDELSDAAKFAGSVNTVVNIEGKLRGYTTDGKGFARTLKKDYEKTLILGTGGAAKAIRYELKNAIMLSARNEMERTKEEAKTADLIVNATPLGMKGKEDFKNFDFLNETKADIYDLIYHPSETTLLKRAKSLGLRVKNGEEMLYEQAKLSFELFTNSRGRKQAL